MVILNLDIDIRLNMIEARAVVSLRLSELYYTDTIIVSLSYFPVICRFIRPGNKVTQNKTINIIILRYRYSDHFRTKQKTFHQYKCATTSFQAKSQCHDAERFLLRLAYSLDPVAKLCVLQKNILTSTRG